VIVGSGPGLNHLREAARDQAIIEHVIFTGRLEPSVVAALLATADIALYPYHDSLINRAKSPSKITAYMAMGRPIVASAVGELVAYLDGGRAGLLVEPDNADAFAAGMMELLLDRERAAIFGKRAEERIWAHYDWDDLADTVLSAYQYAIGSH
jgi:glycosyltransferase involved in cell wall biosynthesis